MGEPPGLELETEPKPGDIHLLEQQLYEFNVQTTGIADGKQLASFLRDAEGRVLGGVYGWTWGATCYVRYLFVPAQMRKRGYGSRLMAIVEAEASARGCKQIVLETHDFQAPQFYCKQGFAITGRVCDYPCGHQYLTLVKRLQCARGKQAAQGARLRIRLALPGEAALLSRLCMRSKSHWGYDAQFLERASRSLQIDPAAIDAGRVFVAIEAGGGVLGVADCCALPEPHTFDLLHLFVEPSSLRRGVGRALFEAACGWCVAQGGRSLLIQSDPNAVLFYQRLGARPIGETPSDAVPDRMLPLLEFRLAR
ncbi:MAG TPA: GNAT family N-acetyltransferase [Hyphomicrobiaceae bacterium]|nr:GNAT family N-acetyltransferase [Hyphomicrobiaceae bacterium]